MIPVARRAIAADAAAIAAIYNQGIEDRAATFETRLREAGDIEAWIADAYPVIAVESGGRLVAFASGSLYRSRECYAGIWEFSVYVARADRGRGHGSAALDALKREARQAGAWKLVSRVFLENLASRRLLANTGFREVGVYLKHGRLDGVWRDVVIVECLL
ncbi:MAG: arsinothricin resistance N-acetyltransferase ArsN1 family A [Aliidongia sp.]